MGSTLRKQALDGQEIAVFNNALGDVEDVMGATVWAVLATDDVGSFLLPRPDCELAVLRFLASADWKSALRIAEEHFV